MTDSNRAEESTRAKVGELHREATAEARKQARKPSAVLAFVGSYVLFAMARLLLRFNEGWYEHLQRPIWVLPIAVQEVAWFIAFGLLALSTVQTVKKASGTTTGTIVFGLRAAHFVALQAFVFLLFGFRNLTWAAADAVVLASLAAATALTARNRTQTAAWLLGIYALWAAYNAAATWALALANR